MLINVNANKTSQMKALENFDENSNWSLQSNVLEIQLVYLA